MKKETLHVAGIGPIKVVSSRRSKNLRLTINSGQVRVAKPSHTRTSAVLRFVTDNKDWIIKQLATSKQTKLISDGDVLAKGVKVIFASYDAGKVKVTRKEDQLLVEYPSELDYAAPEVQKAVVEALIPIWREHAKSYLPKRLETLAKTYNFQYKSLRLKYIHSRWGSCTSSKNINLNIQLMKLDEELIDHVLLHELSHTKALNHGADFWQIFETVRPGARRERKQLKQMTIF